jgi:hypothetical protein
MGNKQKRSAWNKGLIIKKVDRRCEICGKEWVMPKYKTKNRPARFCSQECRNAFFAKIPKHKKCFICGKEFKDRKGGRRKYCSYECYWDSLKRKYPKDKREYIGKRINGVRVRLHRHIMEEKIGRKLKRNEIVHHINGDKHDNRIENLEIISQSEHIKKHFK